MKQLKQRYSIHREPFFVVVDLFSSTGCWAPSCTCTTNQPTVKLLERSRSTEQVRREKKAQGPVVNEKMLELQ